MRTIAALVAAACLAACATPRPILRGPAARDGGAGQAIRECAAVDQRHRESSRGRLEQVGIVAAAVVFTALTGAGVGLLYGGHLGNTTEAVTTGAIVGSGVGLIGGSWFLATKLERDSQIRIGKCAQQRGYEVVGWE